MGLSFQLATLDYSGKLNLWVVVEIYHLDPHGSESDLRLVPGTQGKTGQELEVECYTFLLWAPGKGLGRIVEVLF